MGRGKYRFHFTPHVIREPSNSEERFELTQTGLIDEVFPQKRDRILTLCEQIRPSGDPGASPWPLGMGIASLRPFQGEVV